jgi:hypothetical protein
MGVAVTEKPIRIGVFSTIEDADKAVAGLRNAGFTQDQITVICSDRVKEEHFREYEHQQPAGSATPRALLRGGAVGTALAGAGSVAGAAAMGDWLGLAVGAVVIPAGAIFGGMVAAMMSQGMEKELAEYYDQAVEDGHLLVAAEDHSARQLAMLAEAERVFAEAGANPVALAEG